MVEHATTSLTKISSVMVGPDGDADDVLVAGAEDERDQQEEQEQGTRAPASHKLRGMKIFAMTAV